MSMPELAMTYIVYWPESGVLKVGRAWKWHRVLMMTRSGARVIVCARGTDRTWEAEALRELARWFPPAFRNETEASALLVAGRGWTECFRVDEGDLQFALDRCIDGFARGNDQRVNEAANDLGQRLAVAGVLEGAGRVEADGAGPVAAHGRVRVQGAGAGADRRGPVSGPRRDRDGDGAPADARRLGLPADLLRAGSGVDRAVAAAASGPARGDARVPAEPGPWASVGVRGCGAGRGRAGERVGAGAGASGGRGAGGGVGGGASGPRGRERERAPRPTPAPGCSSDRMRRPPGWQGAGVRAVQDGSAAAGPLAEQAGVRVTARAVPPRESALRAGDVRAA